MDPQMLRKEHELLLFLLFFFFFIFRLEQKMFPYKATAKYLGQEKCTVHVLPKEVSLVPAL